MTGPIAIWGAGGHSKVASELLRAIGIRVACLVESPVGNTVRGPTMPEIVSEQNPTAALAALRNRNVAGIVLGFGQCKGRFEIGKLIVDSGLELVTVIHPSSVVANNVELGKGVFVGAGCVIDPGVAISDFSIVNHRVVLCHDTRIGRACHVCPGVVVAGGCTVGDLTWLGAGSTCRDHVRIGERVFVGSGSNVVSDMASGSLAYGNPAKYVRPSPDVF